MQSYGCSVERASYELGVRSPVKVIAWNVERVVGVSQVVIDGASARATSHHGESDGSHSRGIELLPWVLITSHYDAGRVAIEKADRYRGVDAAKQVVFECQVEPRIR